MITEWPTQKQLGEVLGVTRQRVAQVLKTYSGRRNAQGRVNGKEAMIHYESSVQQRRRKRPEKQPVSNTETNGEVPDYLVSQCKKEAALRR